MPATAKSTAPLTPAMVEAVKNTAPRDIMAGGGTRAALMRRGIVHSRESGGTFGTLTEAGLQVRAKMLPAPEMTAETATALVAKAENTLTEAGGLAAEVEAILADAKALETQPEAAQEIPAHPMRSTGKGNGKSAGPLMLLDEARALETRPEAGTVQAGTVPLEPMRHRFHGKTLGQRRSRRKAQRAARRQSRS